MTDFFGFGLRMRLKHDNAMSVPQLLQLAAASMAQKDFKEPLSKLASNWVETVADLRVLIQEGQLRGIGLPLRLCLWIEEELCSIQPPKDALFNLVTQSSVGDPVKPIVISREKEIVSSGKEYVYQSDFDENGIVYNLSTNGRTAPWVNSADVGIVTVTASSILGDSTPMSAVVGRDVVRCATKSLPNSWIAIDFQDKRVQPSAYTLRHYVSWDSEAIRFWRFEASHDGVSWVTVSEHNDDATLNKKGATGTWRVAKPNYAFRYFRVFQFKENSHNHHFLPLSGFEIYGYLYQSDGCTPYTFVAAPVVVAPRVPLSPVAVSEQNALVFTYARDFDGLGIIHYLATAMNSKAWQNPMVAGAVQVAASSLAADSKPTEFAVGNEVVRCVTKAVADSWFTFDLMDKLCRPTHYTLRHYASWDVEAVRNWLFQGSNDGENWTTLRTHVNDAALNVKGATFTWQVPFGADASGPAARSFFRMFRVFQTGLNSNKHLYLAISGFELYGTLVKPGSGGGANAVMPAPSLVPLPQLVVAPVVVASKPPDNPPLKPVSVIPPVLPEGAEVHWDQSAFGKSLRFPSPSVVENTGSSEKWQLARSLQSFHGPGVHRIACRITVDPVTSNTWRFIIGLIPSDLDCNGPKQWVGTSNSWGWIAGTGGKCHSEAKSVQYGDKYGLDDVVGIQMDFDARTVEFFRNGKSQGVAFANLVGVVHLGASLTATGSRIQIVPFDLPAPLSKAVQGWDADYCSPAMQISPATPTLVVNGDSKSKWQSTRSRHAFSPEQGDEAEFTVELVNSPPTNNSWTCIVGIVPPEFICKGDKQWVGASGWGYIGGTGGICCREPKSNPYGERFDSPGTRIKVKLNFPNRTVEFFKNGVSQGIAFTNLPPGPVHAAVSLTATDASARLSIG